MNQLKVNQQHTIVSLFGQGWSKRRIARELDLDRATVRKYLTARTAKPPALQTGALTQIKRHRRGIAEREKKGSLTHGKKTPEKRCP